uniref:Uncharacterized protein n=1 Tax=Timema shepardi TaxID=629360 RepID=A0A7R9AS01_TIMSH|nr:unnamed protein product [Timema shepardi]
MASTTCVRKSLVSLNSWGIPNNGGTKERSNSNASCKTASAIYVATSGMVDFWNRVSQQMSYIDTADGTNTRDSLHVGQDLSTTDLSSRSSPMHPAIQNQPLGGFKPKKNDAKSLDSCASGESSCNIAGHAFLEEESPPVSPKQDRAESAPCGQLRRQDAVNDDKQGPSSLPWYRIGFVARKPDHRKSSYSRQTDKNQRETWHHVFADGDLKTATLYINPQYEELELLRPTDSSHCSEGKRSCAVIPNSATATSALMETASIGGGHASRTRLSRFQHQFNYGTGERRLSAPVPWVGFVGVAGVSHPVRSPPEGTIRLEGERTESWQHGVAVGGVDKVPAKELSRQRELRWEAKELSRQRESRWEAEEQSRLRESRWEVRDSCGRMGSDDENALSKIMTIY